MLINNVLIRCEILQHLANRYEVCKTGLYLKHTHITLKYYSEFYFHKLAFPYALKRSRMQEVCFTQRVCPPRGVTSLVLYPLLLFPMTWFPLHFRSLLRASVLFVFYLGHFSPGLSLFKSQLQCQHLSLHPSHTPSCCSVLFPSGYLS